MMLEQEQAIENCLKKGYERDKHHDFWQAVRKEQMGELHDPCGYCGRVAYARIRGELQECHGCWEVTRRLAEFIASGGDKAVEFVRHTLDLMTGEKKRLRENGGR